MAQLYTNAVGEAITVGGSLMTGIGPNDCCCDSGYSSCHFGSATIELSGFSLDNCGVPNPNGTYITDNSFGPTFYHCEGIRADGCIAAIPGINASVRRGNTESGGTSVTVIYLIGSPFFGWQFCSNHLLDEDFFFDVRYSLPNIQAFLTGSIPTCGAVGNVYATFHQ